MEDKTDEELVDNTANPFNDPGPANPNQGTENMEVHHHPQVEKKNFREYFLEFIMIFLAVTMGFFAESIRESISDNHKEKEYIRSFIEDLKKDSVALTQYIHISIPYSRKWMDSQIVLLQSPSFKGLEKKIYQAFAIANIWDYNYFKTSRTLSQLNTEGFRLIKNRLAVEAITGWEIQLEYNNQVLNKTIELQTDIDMAASTFADKDYVGQLASLALERLPQRGVAFVDMADIPDSVELERPANDELAAYIKKLKVYNYYLISNVQQDYRYDLKVLNKTLASLESLNG
jgi:hypothetical protein